MDEESTGAAGLFGQHSRRAAIDGHGQFLLTLGAVDGRVGAGVENDVRGDFTNPGADGIGTGQIERIAVARNYFRRSGEGLEQRAAKLPLRTGDENARPGGHAKTSAVCNVAPFASLSETIASSSFTGQSMARSRSFH